MGALCDNAQLKRRIKAEARQLTVRTLFEQATGIGLAPESLTYEEREAVGHGTSKYTAWVHYFVYEDVRFKVILSTGNSSGVVYAMKRTFKPGGFLRGPRTVEKWIRIYEPDDLIEAGVCK